MRHPLILSICLSALVPFVWSSLQPSPNARRSFATKFYHSIVYNEEKQLQNYLVSPAAIQKLLIVIYNGAEESVAETILWDLHVKQINWTYILEQTQGMSDPGFNFIPMLIDQETEKLKNQSIAREDVLKFFENDFTELNDKISYGNILSVYNAPARNPDFAQFAKTYFNTIIDTKKPQPLGTSPRKERTGRNVKKGRNGKNGRNVRTGQTAASTELILLSLTELHAHWKVPFDEVNGAVISKGKFKTGDHRLFSSITLKVVELPLQADVPLTMMIFTAQRNDLRDYLHLTQNIYQSNFDFDNISNSLKEEEIEVKLPSFNISYSTNATAFFKNSQVFNGNLTLNGIFPNATSGGVKIRNFRQTANLKLCSAGIGIADNSTVGNRRRKGRKVKNGKAGKRAFRQDTPINPNNTFDVTKQPFFFVIRSEKVYYFIGHYVGE